jgi:hypothetical protein
LTIPLFTFTQFNREHVDAIWDLHREVQQAHADMEVRDATLATVREAQAALLADVAALHSQVRISINALLFFYLYYYFFFCFVFF